MNIITKSTIVIASIAGASAANLRFHDFSSTSAEVYHQPTVNRLDVAFLEKTSKKYDCTGTTMKQLIIAKTKNTNAEVSRGARCNKEKEKYEQRRTTGMSIFNINKEKIEKGIFPIKSKCTKSDCATPNSIYHDEEKRINNQESLATKISDARITKSSDQLSKLTKLLQAAEFKNNNAVTDFNLIKKQVRTEEKKLWDDFRMEKTKDIDDKLRQKKGNQDNFNLLKEASLKSYVSVVAKCNESYKERMDIILKDERTLRSIQTQIATLKLCPPRGTATEFLETDIANRLESHCALSRKIVRDKAKSIFLEISGYDFLGVDGNMDQWDGRVIEERNAALVERKRCTSKARKGQVAADDLSKKTKEAHDALVDKNFKEAREKKWLIHNNTVAVQQKILKDAEVPKNEALKRLRAARKNQRKQQGKHANLIKEEQKAALARKMEISLDISRAQRKKDNYLSSQKATNDVFKIGIQTTFQQEMKDLERSCNEERDELVKELNFINKIISKLSEL
jgi:hypothetical protein